MIRKKYIDPKCVPYLYHWQRFVPEHLTTLLRDQVIYCSNPTTFNDPWDCKPSFNTELLRDEGERELHIEWCGKITRKLCPNITDRDIVQMQKTFRESPKLLAEYIDKVSMELWPEISDRYRVYCLGPHASNTLMWAHYADAHRGICLEFSTRNEVLCCALRVEYHSDYPLMRLYSDGIDENLLPLLTKSDVWSYEQEYRLVAQEQGNETEHDTLITNNNYLKLPQGALTSIIVGCQGPLDKVNKLVKQHAPRNQIRVKQAVRHPNRYELSI